MEEKVLIEAKNLKKYFKVGANSQLHAVDGVNFKIKRGTTLGVVGESGCGKSTLGRLLLRLYDVTDGQIIYDGTDITKLKNAPNITLEPEGDGVRVRGWGKSGHAAMPEGTVNAIGLVADYLLDNGLCNDAERAYLEALHKLHSSTAGTGLGKIPELLRRAFCEEGYHGFLTLEPHLAMFDFFAPGAKGGKSQKLQFENNPIVEKMKSEMAEPGRPKDGAEAYATQYHALVEILNPILN